MNNLQEQEKDQDLGNIWEEFRVLMWNLLEEEIQEFLLQRDQSLIRQHQDQVFLEEKPCQLQVRSCLVRQLCIHRELAIFSQGISQDCRLKNYDYFIDKIKMTYFLLHYEGEDRGLED